MMNAQETTSANPTLDSSKKVPKPYLLMILFSIWTFLSMLAVGPAAITPDAGVVLRMALPFL